MTLRAEIRTAIDEVAPPAPYLEQEVSDAIWDFPHPARAKMGRSRPVAPLRASLSLVAATLIIALMAGLVLMGRAWVQHNAPLTTPHVINQTELKSLELRSLQMPVMQLGAACPEGPMTNGADHHGGPPLTYGNGPVYANRGQRGADAWGTWVGVGFTIDPRYSGMMLVRARDLRTNQSVVFATEPENIGGSADFSVPGIPTGNLVGTHYDPVWHQTLKLYSELVVLQSGRATDLPGWPGSWATVGIPIGASGCIGFQVDSPGFTEVYVVDEAA